MLLVEMADRVLTTFPPSLSEKASRSLEHLGVTPLLSHTVVDIDDESVTVEAHGGASEHIPARTVIWAAGVTAASLARRLGEATGAEVDRAGRVSVGTRADPSGPSRGDRARRHGAGPWRGWRPAGPSRGRAGGDAAGPLRRQARQGPPARQGPRAVPLPRQGQPRDDRPGAGRRGPSCGSPERISRLGHLARGPPLVPDRVPEPAARDDPLVVQLLHARPGRAGDRAVPSHRESPGRPHRLRPWR